MPLVAPGARPGGAPHFTYAEIPGWDVATWSQLNNLNALIGAVVEPARDALGVPIVVTPNGWIGGEHSPSSVHPTGAALDLAAGSPLSLDATWSLFVWLAQNARYGELIFEQPSSGVTGHVHVTLPGFGGVQQTLYQRADGGLLAVDPFLARRLHV